MGQGQYEPAKSTSVTVGPDYFAEMKDIYDYLNQAHNLRTAEELAQNLRLRFENSEKQGYFLTKKP